jgi:sulfhydrogenase subunit beta (sulfur reductase)
MNLHVMSKETIGEWVALLNEGYRIIGPKRKQGAVGLSPSGAAQQPEGDRYFYDEIQSAEELVLSFPGTILPPKKVLLPQKEELVRFKNGGRQVEPVIDDRPTVVLGIHTCDLHAIRVLDEAMSQGAVDQHYLARRANTVLVSIECLEPCSENAFCKDMGTWTVPETFDLHLTDLGDDYMLEVGSAKGVALIQDMTSIRPATDADHRRLNRAMSAKWPRFPYRLDADLSELPSLMALSYRSQVWEEVGQRCLGCGSCTVVCPTCFCFDVIDDMDLNLSSGTRIRIWDSCQFGEFATVAGGHDFRNGQAARQRHRFYHKFKYLSDNIGLAGCVGCGRCSDACLVNIRPVDVLNDLQRKEAAVAGKRREVVR